MVGDAKSSPKRQSASPAAAPVCGQLRVMFDVTSEPMPECLASLTDRLDAAFARGELSAGKRKGHPG